MNDYNGVIRGPYLSRGDKGHRISENCSYPLQNSKSKGLFTLNAILVRFAVVRSYIRFLT